MKIKNIRQYRTFYKENIRQISDASRNENFMGTFTRDEVTKKKKFGWFDIYHGDKEGYGLAEDGIKNFLQSFLDMAKDGQAVYEFLQNAVDAGSSHFTMVWGQDPGDGNHYVMVANNGEMFNQKSIRSILNVGSSTKTADSQNIGKFGIGFKLAHRLVGKENGLEELLSDDPSGPILFSWKNYEIDKLAKGENPVPAEIDYKEIKEDDYELIDYNPWLFKILITCFPTLPQNDLVADDIILTRDNLKVNNAFRKSEYETLARWVKKYKDILDKDLYKEGSLFFIKLGTGKEHDLADQNLAEGVKFSLAILQETAEEDQKGKNALQTVQLNRQKPIEKPDLQYQFFKVTKKNNLEEYLYIRFGLWSIEELTREQKQKFKKESDIEVLFGFRPYDETADYFKGAPNFYLYFPLSEEVHNFNFVLHSNAFYKASSRTFLHKGTEGEDGINERLLKTIANKLEEQLKQLFHSGQKGDKEKFLNLYAALLTSTESTNNERQWVRGPFINTLTKVLQKVIPVRASFNTGQFHLTSTPPLIRKTAIDLPPEAYGDTNLKWFYWGINAPANIIDQAEQKLNLKVFDVFRILLLKNTYRYINEWIEEDYSRIKLLLEELRFKDEAAVKSEHFKENFKKLRLFRFPDGTFISDEELVEKQKDGYIVLHKNLKELKIELQKIGIQVSSVDLDELDFYSTYNPYFSNDSQLRNYSKIIEIVSNADIEKLSVEEKWKIFRLLRDGTEEGKRIERLGELRLFENNLGEYVKMKNILKSTEINWLKPFTIKESESHTELNNYLVNKEKEYYENILFPFWADIAKNLAKEASDKKFLFKEIFRLYELSDKSKNEELQLGEQNIILFQGQARQVDNLYYHPNLAEIPEQRFPSVQKVIFEKLSIQIPDYEFLDICNSAPFKLESTNDGLPLEGFSVTDLELKSLVEFWNFCRIKILNEFTIKSNTQDTYDIVKENTRSFYSNKIKVQQYVEKYHGKELTLLPEVFEDFLDIVQLRENNLSVFLINNLTQKDRAQYVDLIDSLGQENQDILFKLFKVNQDILLDTGWKKEEDNVIQLKFIRRLLQLDYENKPDLHDKVLLKLDGAEIYLNSIDSANDRLVVKYRDKEIILSRSKILDLGENNSLQLIQEFASSAIERELLTEKEARYIFKIKIDNITQELIDQFLNNSNKKIGNKDQLLLVLSSGRFDEKARKGLQVLDENQKWQFLSGNWILPENNSNKIYDSKYVLSKVYKGLAENLGLGNDECLIYSDLTKDEDVEDIIISSFQFRKECVLDVLEPTDENISFLNHLYNFWVQTPSNVRIKKPSDEWESFMGFVPVKKVLGRYILEVEQLEKKVESWIGDHKSKKIAFFRDLGVQTEGSDISRLRQWLMKGENSTFSSGIEQISDFFLENTLIGLAEGYVDIDENFQTTIDSKQHEIIVRIISHLRENVAININYRIPVYSSPGKISLGSHQNQLPKFLSEENHKILLNEDLKLLPNLLAFTDIIHQNPKYVSLITDNYEELEVRYEFLIPENAVEHNEPFYKSWVNEYSSRLFKVPYLEFEAIAINDEEEHSIGTVKFKNYVVVETEEEWHIYYKNSVTLEEIVIELEENEKIDFAHELEEFIDEKDKMLKAFYHAINSSGRGEIDDEDLKRLYDNLKERNSEDRRKEIIENISEEQRYSYQWFLGYIEYLLSFEELADTTTQKSISFQRIEPCILNERESRKHFMLRGATSMIPLNIEAFEDFKIGVVYGGGKKENIIVEGVSKKGQDLQVYVPAGISSESVERFSRVVNIKISFSPVLDLVQKLYSAFKNEDVLTPWVDIKEDLQPLHFIYGPPGTGKTTKICRTLEEEYDINPFFKALILVPTNKAGDVIAKKILTQGSNLSVLRIGSPTDPELEDLDLDIYQPSVDEAILDKSNVIISTIHRFPYYQISKEHGTHFRLYSPEIKWDMVIFDEASMISLPYVVLALMSLKENGHHTDFIIAGDPKQIPPVVDTSDKNLENLNMDDENIYKMMGIHSFKEAEQDLIKREEDVIENLTSQYRSIEPIGKLFSGFSYDDLLSHKRDLTSMPGKKLPEGFIDDLKSPVSLINFPIDKDTSVLEPRKLLYSSYHVYVGILTAELIKNLDKSNVEGKEYTVGIISPYKAQSMLMNKLITSSGISSNINVHCDTVHGFQGDECDIIIFVVNPNNTYFTGHKNSLLNKEYIYNVAMSRARDYLWVLNPFKAISNNPYINKVREIIGPQVNILDHKIVEKYLFKNPEYIVNNSYLTGHDSINVFGQMEMKYFIKAGNTAIDIQLINNNGSLNGHFDTITSQN